MAILNCFGAAVQRRLPTDKNFALTLSGGRDSRHILLELCVSGHKPEVCVTVGSYLYSENSELEANEGSSHVNVNHVILSQTDTLFSLEHRKNLKTNFCADEHEWVLRAADYLKGRAKIVYDGLGGSLFCDGFGLNKDRQGMCESGKVEQLAIALLGDDSVSGVRTFKSAALKTVDWSLALERMKVELERHFESPNPVCSFYFWNRTRREVALSPYRIFGQFETVFSPFTDQALTDFLSGIPGKMVLDHTLHDDTITRAFPRAGAIPYAKKAGDRSGASKEFRQYALDVAKMGIKAPASSWLNYYYHVPRIRRCLIDSNYSSSILWLGPVTTYMLQLEELQRVGNKCFVNGLPGSTI